MRWGSRGWYDYGARFYDPLIARWNTPDPLAEKFEFNSPYTYTYDDPIKHNDPDGKSGVVTIDNKHSTVTVYSHLIIYGGAANAQVASKIGNNIENQWNAANGKVMIDGREYSVKFSISSEFRETSNIFEKAALAIAMNTDDGPENNYIDVENKVDGGVSYMNGLGSNKGNFQLDNIWDNGETTSSHEWGHGLGLDHPKDNDIRGQGQPNIMAPRGTIVDPKYQRNPNAITGDSKNGGTLDPKKRKVTQKDINNLHIEKLHFNAWHRAKLGGN